MIAEGKWGNVLLGEIIKKKQTMMQVEGHLKKNTYTFQVYSMALVRLEVPSILQLQNVYKTASRTLVRRCSRCGAKWTNVRKKTLSFDSWNTNKLKPGCCGSLVQLFYPTDDHRGACIMLGGGQAADVCTRLHSHQITSLAESRKKSF